jgi:hypothetical protein
MQLALSGLAQIPGVRGYAVFDQNGQCLAHDLPAPYEPILMAQAMEELAQAFDALKVLDEWGIETFVGRFQEGCLVMKPLANHRLVILTVPEMNMVKLNIGVTVASLKFERGDSGGGGSAGPSQSFPRTSSGFGQSLPPRTAPSMTSWTASPVSESLVPADAVGQFVMTQLLKLFTARVGPMAKILMGKQMRELGLQERTVGLSQYGDVVTLLARNIAEGPQRQDFIGAARALTGR